MSEVRFTKDEMVFYQLSGYWLTNRESRDPIGYEGAYLFKICFINSKFKKKKKKKKIPIQTYQIVRRSLKVLFLPIVGMIGPV